MIPTVAQPFVVVMPSRIKRIGIAIGQEYKFVTHNCAFDLWIIFFAGRLVEWQINFGKMICLNSDKPVLCLLWRTAALRKRPRRA